MLGRCRMVLVMIIAFFSFWVSYCNRSAAQYVEEEKQEETGWIYSMINGDRQFQWSHGT
jgi:hypothetical protein